MRLENTKAKAEQSKPTRKLKVSQAFRKDIHNAARCTLEKVNRCIPQLYAKQEKKNRAGKSRSTCDRERMSVRIRREKNASNPSSSAIMRMQNARCEMARKTGLRRAESIHKSTQKAPWHSLQTCGLQKKDFNAVVNASWSLTSRCPGGCPPCSRRK